MNRVVSPEKLDDLPSTDPKAVGSRGDLRKLNRIMGSDRIILQSLRSQISTEELLSRPIHLIEIGAGDGTLLLRMARRLAALGIKAQVILLDRQHLISTETYQAFNELEWSVASLASDVFDWLEHSTGKVDLVLTNLFLHHFQREQLEILLRLVAERANLFIACEPRRSAWSLLAARLIGLIGCNEVTRHDAAVSVRAGFSGKELSALWPADASWQLNEGPAGAFSHSFVARRNA